MKKTILTIVLFLSLFFVSSNVFAVDIEEGTVRCQYYKEVCEEKEGKNTCREDMVTLTFDVTEGSSKLTVVTVRIDNVIDEVSEKHTTLFSGVTGTAKCPSSIDLTVKTDENNNKVFTLTKPGAYILNTDGSIQTNAPSWLGDGNKVSCANIGPFSKNIPRVTSLAITVMFVIGTALFVIMGTVDFFKATMSGKDETIKKNQKAFIDRLVAAILLFLIVVLAKLFISIITNALGTNAGIVECIDCFINNKCK